MGNSFELKGKQTYCMKNKTGLVCPLPYWPMEETNQSMLLGILALIGSVTAASLSSLLQHSASHELLYTT